jgi:hypothetical protein
MTGRTWTEAEVRAQGVRTTVEVAGSILGGLSRTQAYLAVEHGKFPVPVIRVGRRLVVPTAPILALLGLGPDMSAGGPAPPEPPATPISARPLPRETTTSHDNCPDRH